MRPGRAPSPYLGGMKKSGRESLFSVPDFVRLWISNLLGDVGAAFATLALSVTAVVVLHASTFEVAVIAALGNGAYLLLGMPRSRMCGAASRRRDHRHPPHLLLRSGMPTRSIRVTAQASAGLEHRTVSADFVRAERVERFRTERRRRG